MRLPKRHYEVDVKTSDSSCPKISEGLGDATGGSRGLLLRETDWRRTMAGLMGLGVKRQQDEKSHRPGK